MKVVASVLAAVAMAAVQDTSVLNDPYEVFLDPTRIPGACVVTDANHFRNRSYTFRGKRSAEERYHWDERSSRFVQVSAASGAPR